MSENQLEPFSPAGFLIRVCAFTLDFLLICLGYFALVGVVVIGCRVFRITAEADYVPSNLTVYSCLMGLSIAYTIPAYRHWGTTLGKKLFRMRLVSTRGPKPDSPAEYRQIVLRQLLEVLSFYLFGGFLFLWVLFNRRKLALHELASGTRTVRYPKGAKKPLLVKGGESS